MQLELHENGKFNTSDALAQLDKLLASWWRSNSQAGLAISKGDLYEIMNARDMAQKSIQGAFSRIMETAEARRDNLDYFNDQRFISVGEDCFSRTVFTRWGMKPSAAFGEKSRPFDLSVHPVDSLTRLLKSDFEGYLSPENLKFSEKFNFVINTKYNVGFNHETGREYEEDNFRKLISTYESRVERFREDLNFHGKIRFILHMRFPSPEQWTKVRLFWDTLRERCKSTDIDLLCISTWKHGEKIDFSGREVVQDIGIHLVDANYPFQNYVWHKHAHTQAGFEFEKQVVSECVQILKHGDEPLQKAS